MKCWDDDNGATTCGDLVPPDAIERGYRELDKRGIQRRRIERVPTEEEIERQQAHDALRTDQDRLQAEQEEYDRRLLALYPNLDDLLRARDRKIAELDGQIGFAQDEIRRLKVRRSKLHAVVAGAERIGKQPSAQQRAELEYTNRSIEEHYAFILGKEEEKKAANEQYDFDLRRYRQLRPGA